MCELRSHACSTLFAMKLQAASLLFEVVLPLDALLGSQTQFYDYDGFVAILEFPRLFCRIRHLNSLRFTLCTLYSSVLFALYCPFLSGRRFYADQDLGGLRGRAYASTWRKEVEVAFCHFKSL